MNKTKGIRLIRFIILFLILVLITVMGRLHQIIKIYPPVDAFCPFGGLESAWALIRYQGILKRVALSSFILLFASIGSAFIFRRSFCGNICPLGFLQELFGLGGRAVLKRRFSIPARFDRILRYLKYIVLIAFTALAWKTLTLAIRPFDPWVAYMHLGSPELFTSYLVGTVILALSLLGGIFIDRPFCRYLCPMGGFLALPSLAGISRIERNAGTCINCGKCDEACPMAISISDAAQVKSSECISCAECVHACPVPDTLYFRAPGKNRKKISSAAVITGTALIFTAVIGITTFTKTFLWKAETGLPPQVERLLFGPQRIGGDNTLAEIVQIYRINPAFFAQELGITEEEVFYQTLSEAGIEPDKAEELVNRVYKEAGLDPKNVLGGGGGGQCSGEH